MFYLLQGKEFDTKAKNICELTKAKNFLRQLDSESAL